jgi:hypothetical protein
VLQGKLILQEMCREKVDWDAPLPERLLSPWTRWLENLPKVEQMAVDRCFKPKEFGKVCVAELNLFSDASSLGYGQCTYLRLIDDRDRVHCSFVMAKSRVAPLKTTTIPRLELSAAVLSVQVSQQLQKELDYDVNTVYWTDNQSVLGYISNETKRFHTYVANRVQQICNVSDKSQWNYVSTSENPADVASRGTYADLLVQSSWLTGPDFLWSRSLCQDSTADFTIAENDPEVKRSLCLSVASSVQDVFPVDLKSWQKARRIVAICLKFVQNAKCHSRGFISVEDLAKADELLVKRAQQDAFSKEIAVLNGKSGRLSKLDKLDPFLDENGVLRVGGRIKEGPLTYELKHPVILPKHHLVTDLLVRHFHEQSHQGRGITVNVIRSHGYWILGMTSVVSKLVYKCVTCRKYRRAPESQKMGNIPTERLEPGPAFSHVGADYFGPFYIRDGRKEVKRYGVLFTCLNSRAVHLETANSMEADAFINAFRRFQSVRGPVRTLRCDRGTNFVGAQKELTSSPKSEEKVRNFLVDNGCDFIFNVPHASHMGGVWERQIRSVRNALSALLGSQGHQLDDESFRTFMCEAANIVNSRPLTTLSLNDPNSPQPLTPNHLLTLKSNVVLPPPSEFLQADLYCRKRWRRVQYMANEFWHRWRKELLAQWQERVKWNKVKRNMKVGDIVLIVDDSCARCQWKMAKVIETYPGKDEVVRKVKLIVGDPSLSNSGSKVIDRPIHKLILLLEAEM